MEYRQRNGLEKKIEGLMNRHRHAIDGQLWREWDKNGKCRVTNNISASCLNGEISPLFAIYGLNVEHSPVQWCFRSERSSAEYIKVRNPNNADADNYIDQYIKRMMQEVGNAVNGIEGYEKSKSYSKSLAIPLFKYYRDSTLVVSALPLNTLSVEIRVGHYGRAWGGVHGGMNIDTFDISLPMKKLCSPRSLYRYIQTYFLRGNQRPVISAEECGPEDILIDIYNIDFNITGFVMDISSIPRDDFDNYYERTGQLGYKFKRYASYKTDNEVLSTEQGCNRFRIRDPKAMQLIRFLYILRICGFSEEFDGVVEDILKGRYPNVSSNMAYEKWMIEWVYQYLRDGSLAFERKSYIESFNGINQPKDRYPLQYWNESGGVRSVLELLERLRPICFPDEHFLWWMIRKAELENRPGI